MIMNSTARKIALFTALTVGALTIPAAMASADSSNDSQTITVAPTDDSQGESTYSSGDTSNNGISDLLNNLLDFNAGI
jgi:ABC-type oligopeptide transport system substrate-binding subunit